MNTTTTCRTPYRFEQGPIRPPAEAHSLLLRLTRNCPWNRCSFCPLYKQKTFSMRDVDHVLRDIDTVHTHIHTIKDACDDSGRLTQGVIDHLGRVIPSSEHPLLNAVFHWYQAGMSSIFFQDADSLIVPPDGMKEILARINLYFPEVERITSFGRTHTLVNIDDDDLKTYADLGLNRIHSGLETGSDKILKLVDKGCTKEMHVKAGEKVRHAGIELSECVLLGLGGKTLSKAHALETADVINRINPPIIRFLTLVPPHGGALFSPGQPEPYIPATEVDIAREIKRFLENLNGVTSYVESRNIVNLHQEVEGIMPDDVEKMVEILNAFLDLSPNHQLIYQVGKRLGIFTRLADLNDQNRFLMVKDACNQYNINPDNVDRVIREMMQRYFS